MLNLSNMLLVFFFFPESGSDPSSSEELPCRCLSDSKADPGFGTERERSENTQRKNLNFGKAKGILLLATIPTLDAHFPRLAPVTCFDCFPLLLLHDLLQQWHRLHVFPPLPLVTCFPALGIGCIISRACHRLHVFPRLIGCMFPRPWHWLHVFPR